MQNVREKIKRKLSMRDKNTDLDQHDDHDEIDEETTGHLHREIEKAEQEGHPQGRPGSFLNRMISHGNEKTERQLLAEQQAKQQQSGLSNVSNAGQTTENSKPMK